MRYPRRFNKLDVDHEGIIGTAPRPQSQEPDLFTQAVLDVPTVRLHGLVRGSDSIEAQAAGVQQLQGRTALQARILTTLATSGPLTAGALERRPDFRHCAPSTVRKRLSELKQAGAIVQVGREEGMASWDVSVPL